MKVMQVLLAAGADKNAKTQSNRTPLMECCEFGDVEAVQVLLAAGADLMVESRAGKKIALEYARHHLAVFEALHQVRMWRMTAIAIVLHSLYFDWVNPMAFLNPRLLIN